MWDAIKSALGGGAKAPSPEELRAERSREQLELAFRYGTRLPKPKPPKLDPPAFSVGSCEAMTFSPSGDHIVVPTSNGDFLWEVVTGKKGPHLKGVTNQQYFVFSADGKTLLVSNGYAEFARFEIPSGVLLGKFKAKYKFRLDGRGALGGDGEVVLQLAYNGNFLVLDAHTGRVLLQRQLEPTGCNGQVHWLPDSNEVIVTQTSVVNSSNRNLPSAIWRWRWPLDRNEPVRIQGEWEGLESEIDRAKGLLLLHYGVGERRSKLACVERIRLSDWTSLQVDQCGDGVTPRPSVSHDGKSWAVSSDYAFEIRQQDSLISIPSPAGGVAFHPHRDLVAVSGDSGFVAPLSVIHQLMPHLMEVCELRTLNQRGYERVITLPGKLLPTRVVLWKLADSHWRIEREAIDHRHYFPVRPCVDVGYADDLGRMLLEQSRSPPQSFEMGTQRRELQVGAFVPPATDVLAGVVVAFASDAIEIWPLKPEPNNIFRHHWYPVAAIVPDANAEQLGQAALEMLAYYKPKAGKK